MRLASYDNVLQTGGLNMKSFIIVLAFAFTTLGIAQEIPHELSHLDPEMTGAEYQSITESLIQKNQLKLLAEDDLDEVMSIGKRNLDVLGAINAARPENQKMDLWTAENTIAYPIDAPSISNRTLIRERFNKIVSELPASLKKILFESTTLPSQIDLSDEIYLEFARKLDRAYQSASRWILQEPYLFAYEQRAKDDLRGFYLLRQDSQAEYKLENFDSQNAETQKFLRASLFQMCRNNGGSANSCKNRIAQAVEQKKCLELYNSYKAESQELWDSFFKLGAKRGDIKWTSANPEVATLAFQTPDSSVVQQWLSNNIEDEWKWAPSKWQLKLDFKNSGKPHVVFVAGATPNVNGLGGNRITMDANRPIEHYSTRWTIRHEFGHVLGYPDCYIEFYDSEERVMVNYQLDISNLMCSRRGKLKELHFEEFKRAYFKP